MKKLFFPLIALTLLSASVDTMAAETDAEGYPVLYVKGTEFGGWATHQEYRMTRDGNRYTIKLSSISGEFKISNDDWTVNYGISGSNIIVDGPMMEAKVNGANFDIPEIVENATIFLDYNPADNRYANICCSTTGEVPPMPELWSGTLPLLFINVYGADGRLDNEVISMSLDHKNYFSGEYWLDLNGCEWMEAEGAKSIGSADEPLPLEIKARGNWTRKGFSKKPFKLKLGQKQKMLGLSKSKHFAILAHADDNIGYLRNFTGFNLARRMQLPWSPSQQPVEVIINGDYRGLYFLTESIRVDEDRVNIVELDDNVSDPALISGGYLVELDNYDEPDENQIRMPEKGGYPGYKDMLRITFNTPELYSDIQRMFVNDQFTQINDLVGEASDDLWSYLDLDDAARYYIVNELVSHVEAYHGSTYMFRDRGENQKWHFSPVWDFGNAFNGPTDGYIYDNSPFGMTWVGSFTLNQKFNEKVRSTWKWFMSNCFDGIYEDMERICDSLGEAALSDFNRWDGQPHPDGGSPVVDNRDLAGRLAFAKKHLADKVAWLTERFGSYSDATYPEPERDLTPAAPLPSYITTGVKEISESVAEGEGILYDLQGVRTTDPVAGRVYILVAPGGSTKVMIK